MEFSFKSFKLKVAVVAVDGGLGGQVGVGEGDPLLLDLGFLGLTPLWVEAVVAGGLGLSH